MRRSTWLLVWVGLTIPVPVFAQSEAWKQGRAALEKKDFARAIAALTEAIRANPKDAKAYSDRGWAYKESGDLEKALGDLAEAVRLDPKETTALNNRATFETCRDRSPLVT
jgi:Flp pilus assembly protein TadD